MTVRSVGLLAVCLALAACGGGPREVAPQPAPDTVLAEAKSLYRQGQIGPALERLTQLTAGGNARGAVAAEAYYYLGECNFAKGLYLEAAREFRRVADGYASHPLAPDGLLRAGDALAELWRHPELDPAYGESSMTTYRELLARFPDSPAARRAGLKLAALADRFAEKDYRNGVFYLRLKAHDSAIIYFRSVVANYAQSAFAPRALLKLVETYRTIGYAEETKETCEHLRRFYPNAEGVNETCPP